MIVKAHSFSVLTLFSVHRCLCRSLQRTDSTMPIISRGSDNYSNLSDSSCSTLNQIAPLIHVETCPAKGAFYRRSARVRRASQASSTDQKRHIILNVGGTKYLVPWLTLDEFPLTRLGRLKFCRNYEEVVQICDDYDEASNEYFFDRNPCAFRMIITFISAGKLRLLREMCALSFQEELAYWGVDEANLEACCRRKLIQRAREVAKIRRGETVEVENDETNVLPVASSKLSHFMNKLRDMVENPQSGLPGKVFACVSIIFVTITVVSLCISTMPDLKSEEDRVSPLISQMFTNVRSVYLIVPLVRCICGEKLLINLYPCSI